MWDFFGTVRHRHSVRKYQTDIAVEREKLHAILEMACAAPSAGDLQAYQIIVVSTPAERDGLRTAASISLGSPDLPGILRRPRSLRQTIWRTRPLTVRHTRRYHRRRLRAACRCRCGHGFYLGRRV